MGSWGKWGPPAQPVTRGLCGSGMGAAHPCLHPAELSQALSIQAGSPLHPTHQGAGGHPTLTCSLSRAALPALPSRHHPPGGLGVWCALVPRTTPRLSTDDSGDDEDGTPSPADKSELHGTIRSLSLKLDDLSTCNELVAKHGVALQRSLNELDGLRIPAESSEKLKAVNERATLFRITSNAMINVSARAAGAWVVRAAPPCFPPPPHHPIHAPGAGPGHWPSLSGGARTWSWGPAGASGLGTGGCAERSSELRAHSRDAAATLSHHSCCSPPVLECPAQTWCVRDP